MMYCSICNIYQCKIHNLQQNNKEELYDYYDPGTLPNYDHDYQLKTCNQKLIQYFGDQKRKCSEKCYLICKNKTKVQLNDFQRALIDIGISIFSYDPCNIHLIIPDLPCHIIYQEFQRIKNEFQKKIYYPDLQNIKQRSKQSKNKKSDQLQTNKQENIADQRLLRSNLNLQKCEEGAEQIEINNFKQKINHKFQQFNSQDIIFDNGHIPCKHYHLSDEHLHSGQCDNCECAKRKYCTKNCQCDKELCQYRRKGCKCKGYCFEISCPCYASGEECDPELCTPCYSNHKKCYNNQITLSQSKKTIISKSEYCQQGIGLYALEKIQKNELIMEYTGACRKEYEILLQKIWNKCDDFYNFNLVHQQENYIQKNIVDGLNFGNKSRFINHSKAWTNVKALDTMSQGYQRMGLYASQVIFPGQELFFDYDGAGILVNDIEWINDQNVKNYKFNFQEQMSHSNDIDYNDTLIILSD